MALLVAGTTAVACQAGDPYLAGALPTGLIAGTTCRPNRMALAGPAGLAAGDRLAGVPPEPRLAVVAMPPGSVVAAALADTPALAARQPEQLGVEPAASGVLVAGAG